MARFSIDAVFRAVDLITAPINRIDNRVGRFTRTTGRRLRILDGAARDLASGLTSAGVAATKAVAGSAALGFGAVTAINQATVRAETLAKSVDVSVDTVESLGAAVAGAGFDFETIVDLVEEMNNKLGESAALEQIAPVTESLAILGLEFENIKSLEPEAQFKAIANAALAMEDGQKAAAAADILLGGEANRVIGILRDQGGSIDEIIDRYQALNFVTDRGRAGARQYSGQVAFTAQAVRTLSQEFSGLAGEALTPVLTRFNDLIFANKEFISLKIQDTVTAIADGFTWLIDNIDLVIKWFKRLIIAVVVFRAITISLRIVNTALAIFNFLASLLPAITIAVTALRTAFIGLALAVALNPIILAVVAAVAALAAIVFVVIKNWEPLTEFFSNMWKGIKEMFKSSVAFVTDLVDKIPTLGGIADGITEALDKIPSLDDVTEGITDRLSKIPKLEDATGGLAGRFVGLGNNDASTGVISPQERAAQLTQERIESTGIADVRISTEPGLEASMTQRQVSPMIKLSLAETGAL